MTYQTIVIDGTTYNLVPTTSTAANGPAYKDVWVNVYFNALKVHKTEADARRVAGRNTRGTRKVRVWADGTLEVLE